MYGNRFIVGLDSALELKHKELDEVDRFSLDNPRSIVNLVPDKVRSYILEAIKEYPYFFNKPENLLFQELKAKSRKPDETDEMIRQKFWLEYDRVHAFGLKRMHMANVVVGVCAPDYFYGWYLKDPKRIAWMLCPPKNLMAGWNALFVQGYRRIAEILDVDPIYEDENGYKRLDHKLASLQFSIFQTVDARVHGSIIQRVEQKTKVEQKTVNFNVSESRSREILGAIEGNTVEDLEKEVAILKKENMLLSGAPQEISRPLPELAMTRDEE